MTNVIEIVSKFNMNYAGQNIATIGTVKAMVELLEPVESRVRVVKELKKAQTNKGELKRVYNNTVDVALACTKVELDATHFQYAMLLKVKTLVKYLDKLEVDTDSYYEQLREVIGVGETLNNNMRITLDKIRDEVTPKVDENRKSYDKVLVELSEMSESYKTMLLDELRKQLGV